MTEASNNAYYCCMQSSRLYNQAVGEVVEFAGVVVAFVGVEVG